MPSHVRHACRANTSILAHHQASYVNICCRHVYQIYQIYFHWLDRVRGCASHRLVFFFDLHFEDVSNKSVRLMFDPDFSTLTFARTCTEMSSCNCGKSLQVSGKNATVLFLQLMPIAADNIDIALLMFLRVSRGHVHELAPVLRRLTLTCAYRMISSC